MQTFFLRKRHGSTFGVKYLLFDNEYYAVYSDKNTNLRSYSMIKTLKKLLSAALISFFVYAGLGSVTLKRMSTGLRWKTLEKVLKVFRR